MIEAIEAHTIWHRTEEIQKSHLKIKLWFKTLYGQLEPVHLRTELNRPYVLVCVCVSVKCVLLIEEKIVVKKYYSVLMMIYMRHEHWCVCVCV